jgi:VanZ family protein
MLRYRNVWLIGAWSLVGVVAYLSLMPNPPEPFQFHMVDKVEHGIAYAAMSWWFCQIYQSARSRIAVCAALVAYGVLIEILQGMTGYRYFEYADMLADSIGVVIGMLLACTVLGHVFVLIERIWR